MMNTSTEVSPSIEQAILDYLLDHCDAEETADETTVSRIRQEEIAQHLDLPLGHVITAIEKLQHRGRLRAERQAVGKPFRYHLAPPASLA